VSIIGRDKLTHEVTIEASSLFERESLRSSAVRNDRMRAIAIGVACVCIVLGWWTESLPNVSQKVPGLMLAAYGAAIVMLTLLGKDAMVKWMLIAAAVLLVVAYSLPMSFWRFVGLADKP
jgi:hypothetical protein